MIVSFPITKCKIRELRLEDASRPMDGYCIHFRPSADNTDVLPPSNATIKFIEHVDPECLCGHGVSWRQVGIMPNVT